MIAQIRPNSPPPFRKAHSLTPIQRVQVGALILALAVVGGTVGYRVLGNYGWSEALWMVVITISTVGYGEHTQSPSAVQWLTIAVILVGMSSAVYTFTGAIQLTLEGELERTFGARRMNRQIERLQDHIIICGIGRSGRNLAEDLKHKNRAFVMVDNDEVKIEEAHELGYPAILGDATEENVLLRAGITDAQAIVSVLPSDANNVFITLTARELNPDLLIIASAEKDTTAKKLHQAGARKVVMPSRVSALQISRMIVHPSTADLMALVAESSYLDVELDEIRVTDHPRLIGITVQQSEAHRTHKLLVVAIRRSEGDMVFNPGADYIFGDHDIAIVMGNRKHIRQFRASYGRILSTTNGAQT